MKASLVGTALNLAAFVGIFRESVQREPCGLRAGAPWLLSRDGDPVACLLHRRHYSRRPGRRRVRLVTTDLLAAFGWRRHIARDQIGVCAAFFRSESTLHRSSDLIRAAVAAARSRWPAERFYTFVDPGQVRSRNPGFCFLAAGWQRCGRTRRGLHVLELPAERTEPFQFPTFRHAA